MLSVLEGAHMGFAQGIVRMRLRWNRDGSWDYPHSADILHPAGLQTMEFYIGQRQNRAADWVATRPIMELRLQTKELMGRGRRLRWWWDQVVPDGRAEGRGWRGN